MEAFVEFVVSQIIFGKPARAAGSRERVKVSRAWRRGGPLAKTRRDPTSPTEPDWGGRLVEDARGPVDPALHNPAS